VTQLITVCGEPGVGKSYVADEIAYRLEGDAVVYDTDEIRAELFEDPRYTPQETHQTYQAMFNRAADSLAAGDSAVLDATFKNSFSRRQASQVAAEAAADFEIVRVHCNDWDELTSRLTERDGAGIKVYKRIARQFEPIFRDRIDIFNHQSTYHTMVQLDDAFVRDED